ncbi:winged helix-turn-helix transcriptional regulator [Streptomyces sp. NPDC020951]|uniref:winged helix-turn-helix transcriptional regulator n=1 Tax=Streptomyces sp. NPDC020951 TaxID=3365104 RepID=UPI0037941735
MALSGICNRCALRWAKPCSTGARTAADASAGTARPAPSSTDGFVDRISYPEVPPRVEYSLTPLGRGLVEHLVPLTRWIATHADAIVDTAVAPERVES